MEKKEMYYSFAKGIKGRWLFPVEAEPSVAKEMVDDGLQIIPLPNFVHTDTMKVYYIKAQGNTKEWLLSVPLDPEVAQEFRNGGVVLEEKVEEEVKPKEEVADYFWKESSPEKLEEKPVKKTAKSRSKGKVEE